MTLLVWVRCTGTFDTGETARFGFEPGNRLPRDVKVLFKTHIYIYMHIYINVFVGKSTFVLPTLLIPA